MKTDDGREEVPLRMLEGNIGVLLDHTLPCSGISLIRDPLTQNGVILMIHSTAEDKKTAKKLGFKFGKWQGE